MQSSCPETQQKSNTSEEKLEQQNDFLETVM